MKNALIIDDVVSFPCVDITIPYYEESSMKRSDLASFIDTKMAEIHGLREAGQKEYAHDDTNAFRNFDALSETLGIDRKMVLFVYLQKHIDGVMAFLRGHKSQREPVQGRIKDMIVYSFILWAMIDEEEKNGLPERECEYDPVSVLKIIMESSCAECLDDDITKVIRSTLEERGVKPQL